MAFTDFFGLRELDQMSVGTVIRGAVRTVSGARGGLGGLPPGLRVHCRVYRTTIRGSTCTATVYHPKGLIFAVITANIDQKCPYESLLEHFV